MSVNLPRNALLMIYNSFNPNNEIFQSKLEKVQYRAYLAITGAIKGTSRERLYRVRLTLTYHKMLAK